MLQFTFEKNNLLCKKREKNNLSRGKIPAPPWISNGPSLNGLDWSVTRSVEYHILSVVLIEKNAGICENKLYFKNRAHFHKYLQRSCKIQ